MTRENQICLNGKSYFKRKWGEAPGFIGKQLEYSDCSCCLEVRFYEEEGGTQAYYEDTDCLTLREFCGQEMERTGSLLRAVVRILRMLAEDELESEDYLLSRDCILYNLDTVFVRSETGRTSAAYIPGYEPRVFQERVRNLLEEMEKEYHKSGLSVLKERFEEEEKKGHLGTSQWLRLFSRWERDV